MSNPDITPKNSSEYFHSPMIISPMITRVNCPCFVCGEGGRDGMLSGGIRAYAECKEAGNRIVRMFQTGARLDGEGTRDRPYIEIGACEKHMPQLRFLFKLVRCGKISPDFLYAVRRAVILADFRRMVQHQALTHSKELEGSRAATNWTDAVAGLSAMLGRTPSDEEIRPRALELWQGRRESQAVEDWLWAEAFVSQEFFIAT